MLLYLFESKDGLVRELLARARQDELAAIQGIEGDLEAVTATLWEWLAAPEHRPLLVLWVEAYARSLVEPDGPWAGFARQTVEDWLDVLAQGPAACGTPDKGRPRRAHAGTRPAARRDARPAGHRRRGARHGRPSPEIRPRADARRTALMLCWGHGHHRLAPRGRLQRHLRRRGRRVPHGRGVGAGGVRAGLCAGTSTPSSWSGAGCCSCGSGPFEAPDNVAGWHILENNDRRLVLGAESWHLIGRLVFESEESGARVTTRVTYRHLPGRAVWSVVGPIHRPGRSRHPRSRPAPARPLTPAPPPPRSRPRRPAPASAKALARASSCDVGVAQRHLERASPAGGRSQSASNSLPTEKSPIVSDRPSTSAPAAVARCSRCRDDSRCPSRPSSCWAK